jgi:hypothetical protein
MNKLMTERATYYNDIAPESWAGITKQENGNYLDKYPMGEAILLLPFFLIAHILTILFGLQVNGFSVFYQIFAGLSGVFYMSAGLYFLNKFLRKFFTIKITTITLILVTLGTNLFHYGTYDSIFSHTYSFFLFSLFLYIFIKWNDALKGIENRRKIKISILIGVISGLIFITRPTNIIFPVILIIFYDIRLSNFKKSFKEKFYYLLENYRYIFIISLVAVLVFIPQLLYWKAVTGNFFVFSYKGESFDFTKPEVLNVLFSVRKGLLFWSPIITLSFFGIYLFRKKYDKWILPIIIFVLLNLYIISSWWYWAYGGSFGHRAFIESFSILSLPLAYVIEIMLSSKKYLKLFTVILISLVLYSTFMMALYWFGRIPIDGTTIGILIKAVTFSK